VSKVHIYMLTEDGGDNAHLTWSELLRRMCRIVDRSCDTQEAVLHVEKPEPGVRAIMSGNGWRNKKSRGRSERVHFWKTIADQLESEEVTAVIFHVDGDVVWSKRGFSENVRDVHDIVIVRLRETLSHRGRNDIEIDACLAKFLPLHPFREIEAWLFHNTDELYKLYQRRHRPTPACVSEWRSDPALLDEEPQPKKRCTLGSTENTELARRLSRSHLEAMRAQGTSFAQAVETLASCESLRAGLRRTYGEDRYRVDGLVELPGAPD